MRVCLCMCVREGKGGGRTTLPNKRKIGFSEVGVEVVVGQLRGCRGIHLPEKKKKRAKTLRIVCQRQKKLE